MPNNGEFTESDQKQNMSVSLILVVGELDKSKPWQVKDIYSWAYSRELGARTGNHMPSSNSVGVQQYLAGDDAGARAAGI